MASATRLVLSGGTEGQPILVAATATPGTTIHTVGANTGTTGCEEVWLWANNTSTSPIKLTVEWGGTTSPNNTVEQTIPAEAGAIVVIPGWVLQNSRVIRAFAATANLIIINGYANKIVN